ncbi:MAG: glycosyltransferase [Hyphomonadaceae bacterium]|nr:glycosyltransferase [Hyphomonadaceae bacterium]
MTFPNPIHFVVPRSFFDRLAALPGQTLGLDYPYWIGGQFNWAAQAWLALRQQREGLTIGCAPCAGRINFAHSMVWRALGPRTGEFRVGARADYRRLFDVDFEFLQNPAARCGPRQAYVPYWPIPGLIPRDPNRRALRTVAYAGRIGAKNLSSDLRRELDGHPAMRGLNFATIPPDQWHNMSQIDLLVAVRDFAGLRHLDKPPSKLFNAWAANVPLIGGADSAFAEVGRPGEDYVRATTPVTFFGAVERLRQDPSYYAALVAAGRARLPELSREAVGNAWLELFDGPVAAAFENWQVTGRPLNPFGNALDRGYDMLARARSSLRRRAAAASRA